jgi:hypothetical protein
MSSAHKTAPVSEIERALVDLGRPLPPQVVKRRDGPKIKGTDRYIQLDYVEWHVIADMLNKIVPAWEFQLISLVETKAGDWAASGTLTIAGVSRSNVGTSDKDGANGPKVALSDCLKRCATLFGLGLELYRDEQQNHWAAKRLAATEAELAEREHVADEQPTGPRPVPVPEAIGDPVARTLSDLITPKQIVVIRAHASARGVHADDRCHERFGCRIEELTKRAAAALIEELSADPRPQVAPEPEAIDAEEEPTETPGAPAPVTFERRERIEGATIKTAAHVKLVGICYGRRVAIEDAARQMFGTSSTMLSIEEAKALAEAVKALPVTRIPREQATELEELCKQRGLPLYQTLLDYGVERAEDLDPETAAVMRQDLLN